MREVRDFVSKSTRARLIPREAAFLEKDCPIPLAAPVMTARRPIFDVSKKKERKKDEMKKKRENVKDFDKTVSNG